MIIVLIMLAISIAIILVIVAACDNADDIIAGLITACVCSVVIWGAILGILWGSSYSSYLDIRSFHDRVHEQYQSAVVTYHDYAQIDAEAAFTDLKYQGYQEEMAGFIKDLRLRVVKYNEILIKKRIMKRSPFFNWLIVAPDEEMKTMTLMGDKVKPPPAREVKKPEANLRLELIVPGRR